MADVEHNPYVILGVDYGSSLGEARRGFLQAVKRVRGADAAQLSEEDITSALHTVEQLVHDPASAVDAYRIPADPSVFALDAEGLFGTSASPIARRTPPLTNAEFERILCTDAEDLVRTHAARLRMTALHEDAYGGQDA